MIRSAAIILITLVWSCPLILGNLLRPGGDFARGIARSWAKATVWASGARITAEGLDRLPAGGFVLVANHQSLMDIPLLVSALGDRNMVFITKKWLFDVPIFGRVTKDVGSIIVDEGNVHGAAAAIRQAAAEAKAGKVVVIFPEGTRSDDGVIGEFKPGALAIAARAGKTIGLVAISGSGKVLPKKSLRVRCEPVTLRYAGTWTPEGKKVSVEDAARHCRQIIEAMNSGRGVEPLAVDM